MKNENRQGEIEKLKESNGEKMSRRNWLITDFDVSQGQTIDC